MQKIKLSEYFIPDKIFNSVLEISPDYLQSQGISGLVLDLDNTLATYGDHEPSAEVVAWIGLLRASSIDAVILTNNSEKRVARFCLGLALPFVHSARKPRISGYLKACELMRRHPKQVAQVGDQVYTDVLGANRSGMMSILVNPLRCKGHLFFAFRRALEGPFIRKAHKRGNGP